jgi:hypothetical protein
MYVYVCVCACVQVLARQWVGMLSILELKFEANGVCIPHANYLFFPRQAILLSHLRHGNIHTTLAT